MEDGNILEPGQVIDNFKISGKLGSGNMGEVYEVKSMQDSDKLIKGCSYALKIFKNNLDRLELERFRREISLLKTISHKNIVKYYSSGFFDKKPYLVMELVQGLPCLSSILLKKMNQDVENIESRSIIIGKEISDALRFLHQNNIVHRDVKPENILTSSYGINLLSDFGIAKFSNNCSASITYEGVVLGTPEYMAPEAMTGEISDKIDVYSLGVSLYHILTGDNPFKGMHPADIYDKKINSGLPEFKTHDQNLSFIINSCTSDAGSRPDSEHVFNLFKAAAEYSR